MYTLDNSFNVKHYQTLDFLDATQRTNVVIAIDKNNIIIIVSLDRTLYICDHTGYLKDKFEHKFDSCLFHSLSMTDKSNLVMIRSDICDTVYIYTKDGTLKSTIQVPDGHMVKGVAFHYVISKILALTYIGRENSFFLLCYSRKCELESSTFFCKTKVIPNIISHPSGPCAFVQNGYITFI